MRISLAIPLAAMAAASLGAVAAGAVDERGKPLRVAVYTEFAPFSEDDKGGVDVDVAKALAEKLGMSADIASFKAGETMDDDLRNVVWKGHYLRKDRLADVMMHVPLDPVWARKNEQVRILAPYYRERLVVARNRNVIRELVTLDALGSEKIGVQFDTLEDHYLWSAFGGRFRESLVHYASTLDAAAALRKNEIAAVMGLQSAIEAALAGSAGKFAIAAVATPGLASSGWDVGVAVKADRAELAATVEKAMAELRAEGLVERIFTKRGLSYAAPRAVSPPPAPSPQVGRGG